MKLHPILLEAIRLRLEAQDERVRDGVRELGAAIKKMRGRG